MQEPISYFYEKTGFKRSLISRYIIGDKFVCIMLEDGHIGLCSTLGTRIDPEILENDTPPDTGREGDRIILNAYFNALCNYSNEYEENADILDAVDFSLFDDVVMIGYFETLYEKFRKVNPSLHVFDRQVENSDTEPISTMYEVISSTNAVVVTGTTLFNGSLLEIINATNDGCSVFLLGPSNILHTDMLKYRNVKMVFGSVFDSFDTEIFKQIEKGAHAREFLRLKNKVYIKSDNTVF